MGKIVVNIANGRNFKTAINSLIVDHAVIEFVEDSADNKHIYKFTKDNDVAYVQIDVATLASSKEAATITMGTGYNTATKALIGEHAAKKYTSVNVETAVTIVVSDMAVIIRASNANYQFCAYFGFCTKRNPVEAKNPFIIAGAASTTVQTPTGFPAYNSASAEAPAVLYDTDGTTGKYAYCSQNTYGIGMYDSLIKTEYVRDMVLCRASAPGEIFATVPEITEPYGIVTNAFLPNGSVIDYKSRIFNFVKCSYSSSRNAYWVLDE